MSTSPSAYTTQCQKLLGQFTTIDLKDEDRAFFSKLQPEKDAQEEGDTIHSAVVLDELLRMCNIALPFILSSKIPGFGPLRAKYLAELGLELATHVQGYDQAMLEAAGTSALKSTNLKGSRNLRRTALRILKNLAGKDEAAKARIQKAASEGQEKPDERSRSLEAIADELEAVAAKLSPTIAADAGISPELITGLRLNAKAVLGAQNTARERRSDAATHQRVMNILDGRILFELRALLRAARDARKIDPSLPSIKANRVQRLYRAKKPSLPAPEAPKPQTP